MEIKTLVVRLGRSQYAPFFVSLAVVAPLIVAWFTPMNGHMFFGDDLVWLVQGHYWPATGPDFWPRMFAFLAGGGKIRPVSYAVIVISAQVCRAHFDCYVYFNYVILALNALLISWAAYRTSDKWWPSIFFASIALIVSRFGYYAILQVIGIMENVSMTWLLLFSLSAVNFLKTSKLRWEALAIAAYGLIIFSHERFMVLVVPLLALLILQRQQLGFRRLVASILVVFLLTAGFLLLKQFVFHTSVFAGSGATGGESVLSIFNLRRFLSFVGQGMMTLIGFNTGPAAFSGQNYLAAGTAGILVGHLLSGALVAMILVLVYQRPREYKSEQVATFVFFVLTFGALLASSSITLRQEYRWFYAPFAALILLVCLMLGQIAALRTRAMLTAFLALSFVCVDFFYKPFNQQNMYIVADSAMARSVKSEILDGVPAPKLARKGVYIVVHGNQDIQNWILSDDLLFQVYADIPTIRVHYIDELDMLPTNEATPRDTLVFEINGVDTTRISEEWVADFLSQKRAMESTARVEHDFIGDFAAARISAEVPTETPAGRGAYLSTWQESNGIPHQAITLHRPYAVQFPAVACQPGSMLMFRAAIPDVAQGTADLGIEVEGAGVGDRWIRIRLHPPTDGSAIDWHDYGIPVAGCSGAPINVTLRIAPPFPWQQSLPATITVTDFKLMRLSGP